MLYGKTHEQLIETEWVSDVVSKPSESRVKPETSVETPRVEKELLSTMAALQNLSPCKQEYRRKEPRMREMGLHKTVPGLTDGTRSK